MRVRHSVGLPLYVTVDGFCESWYYLYFVVLFGDIFNYSVRKMSLWANDFCSVLRAV